MGEWGGGQGDTPADGEVRHDKFPYVNVQKDCISAPPHFLGIHHYQHVLVELNKAETRRRGDELTGALALTQSLANSAITPGSILPRREPERVIECDILV